MLKEYLKLREYAEIPWRYFILGMLFMVLSALLSGISISSIVPLMDRIIAGKNIILPENLPEVISTRLKPFVYNINALSPGVLLTYLIAFILSTIFLKGLFSYLNHYHFHFFGNRLLTDIRNRLYSKVATLSMDFFTQGHSGELTSRIIYDVNLLMRAFVSNFPALLFQSVLTLVYLVIIFTIDWKLSLLSMLIFPPVLFPIYRIGKKLRKLGRKIQEAYGRIGNLIHEGVYGQQIIKAYNQETDITERFKKENERIFKTVMSATKRTLLIGPLTEIVSVFGASGLLYFGARKVIEGSLSSGFLFLFFVALFSIISPLKGIGNSYVNLKHDSSALPRLFSILDRQSRIKDTGKEVFTGLKEKIEFKNISFAYGETSVLRGISFSVPRGGKLGIVGPTGVGKTTLIGLLLRFYEPSSGEILTDGKDIRSFTLHSLRDHIGFVTQEPILFNDTIRRNIVLSASPDVKKIEQVVEYACIKTFIESLPEGYETVVGERGTTLSGGQKQLLSIARAIYKNPDILILDEATASLDSNSEKMLQRALERIMEGRTVFIIAHRLSTLRDVDRIIVLKNGVITEEGSHKELFEGKGDYYKLWEIQFSP
jgi:ATP-binding cassette, subfamily B, bacterial MsbA